MSIWQRVSFTHRFSQLPSAFYTLVEPQPLDNTRWVAWNGELRSSLVYQQSKTMSYWRFFLGKANSNRFVLWR